MSFCVSTKIANVAKFFIILAFSLVLSSGSALSAPAQFNFDNTHFEEEMVNPSAIAVGDFNKDGNIDYVIGHSSLSIQEIRIRFGSGDGTFSSSDNINVGGRVYQIIVEDVNNDGNADIILANQDVDSVTILFGNGDGTFAAPVNYLTGLGYQPRAIVVKDFNYDGTNDIASANLNNTISILLAKGDGTFTNLVNYPTGNNPSSIISADFNGDGKPDLAVANSSDNNISIYLGYGDGTFAPTTSYSAGTGTTPIALGEVDYENDGDTDLVVVNSSGALNILTNNAFGGFAEITTYSLAPSTPTALVVADFDNDGKDDLAVTLDNGNVVFYKKLTVGFDTGTSISGDSTPKAIAAGDFNNDDVLDAVVAVDASLIGEAQMWLNLTPAAVGQLVAGLEDNDISITLRATDVPGLNYTIVTPPAKGTLSGTPPNLTYTPNPDYYGTDSFTFSVDDGTITSTPAEVRIIVTPVNDPPHFVLLDSTLTVLEDAPQQIRTGWATSISKGPSNESGQGIKFIVTTDNPSLFQIRPYIGVTGTLVFKPAKNANGSANVTVTIRDTGGTAWGGIDSYTDTFTIVVTPVNDPPTFKPGPNITVDEDCGPQVFPNWATSISPGPADEASQSANFEVVNISNPGLFADPPAISPDGTLTFTPADDAFGRAAVTIRLKDDGGTANGGSDTSRQYTFYITVRSVNDQPYFEIASSSVTVLEDAPQQTILNFVYNISKGPANENKQNYYFFTQNDNPNLFSVQPTIDRNGTLKFLTKKNANGTATVTVYMRDSGGTAYGGVDTYSDTFTIDVTPVNDAPTITTGPGIVIDEDYGTFVYPAWAKGISAGPPNESSQNLTLIVTNNNNALFEVQPTIDLNTGNLTFKTAQDANGVATVYVVLQDDGGTDNGGVDATPIKTFNITVRPVNDPPSCTLATTLISLPASTTPVGFQAVENISTGPSNESSQTVTFQVLNNTNTTLFLTLPVVSPQGVISFRGRGVPGQVTLAIKMIDSGGTAYGGKNTFITQTNLTIRFE